MLADTCSAHRRTILEQGRQVGVRQRGFHLHCLDPKEKLVLLHFTSFLLPSLMASYFVFRFCQSISYPTYVVRVFTDLQVNIQFKSGRPSSGSTGISLTWTLVDCTCSFCAVRTEFGSFEADFSKSNARNCKAFLEFPFRHGRLRQCALHERCHMPRCGLHSLVRMSTRIRWRSVSM